MTDKIKSILDDIAALRLNPGDFTGGGEREVEVRIPIRKPTAREFFRVNPDPAMALPTTIIIDREAMRHDVYLVAPAMRKQLEADIQPATLVLAATRQGTHMIWPIPLPVDGRQNEWHERARTAAERSKTRWVRMAADMAFGTYRIFEAVGDLGQPTWPNETPEELFKLAFAANTIENPDHPMVRRLLGAA